MKLVDVDARAIRTALFNDGYVVIREVVPKEMCDAVLEAFGTELEIWMSDPGSWDRVSTEVDQVPLWGHQSQWDIRQLPEVHRVWSTVWGTEKLWVLSDSTGMPILGTHRFSGSRESWRSLTPAWAREGSAAPRESWPTETVGRSHGKWSSGAPSTGLTVSCVPAM
jgi:hypothetical protein